MPDIASGVFCGLLGTGFVLLVVETFRSRTSGPWVLEMMRGINSTRLDLPTYVLAGGFVGAACVELQWGLAWGLLGVPLLVLTAIYFRGPRTGSGAHRRD